MACVTTSFYDKETLTLIGGLADEMLGRRGCTRWGISMRNGKDWESSDISTTMTYGSSIPAFPILHDERGGPYFSCEQPDILCSQTDENGICLCMWAQCPPESGVLGIGIDLAAREDFAGKEDGGEKLAHLVLDETDIRLAREMFPDDYPCGYAYAFAAKEAAFKSMAPALRTWYLTQNEPLIFEVREFVQSKPGHMRGTARKARAQEACGKLGITDILVSCKVLPEAVFTLACAIGSDGRSAISDCLCTV